MERELEEKLQHIFRAGSERFTGGMDSSFDDSEKLPECDCDECNEMRQMRLSGGCNTCNQSVPRKKCKCPEPEPEPEPIYEPPPCPHVAESNVVTKATKEEGAYDEFEANLNGTGITIRVLKNSHTVTDVIDSENEDSGCEVDVGRKKVSCSFEILIKGNFTIFKNYTLFFKPPYSKILIKTPTFSEKI